MAMRPLTPGEYRLLAVLLLLGVIAALAVAVYIPVRSAHRHYDETIAARLDHLARFQRVAAQRADLEAQMAKVRARDASRFYLKVSTPALAAADIQQVVQTLIEANGLRLESMQISPHKDEGGHRRITVNLRVRGKLSGIQNMLYSLEASQPYLFVDALNVQSTVRQNYAPMPGVEPDVMVMFDLSGYAQVKKPNAQPKH